MIRSVVGNGVVVAFCAALSGAADKDLANPPAIPVAHAAAATDDFKKLRREPRLIYSPPSRQLQPSLQITIEPYCPTSPQFVEINLGIINFLRLHDVFPSDLMFSVGRLAGHHAGNGRFRSLLSLI